MEESQEKRQSTVWQNVILTQQLIPINKERYTPLFAQVFQNPKETDSYTIVFPPNVTDKNRDYFVENSGFGFEIFQLSIEQGTLEQIQWSEEQKKDVNNTHIERSSYTKSVTINNRLYLFSNLSPQNNSSLKIIDILERRIFPINSGDFKPSTIRVNYSISNYKQKVYFYGGLDENNKLLSTMDEFDATTYKFTLLKYRGDFKPKGRQGHCAVSIDQYNMFIFGGTTSEQLIDPVPIGADEIVINFDMDAFTFSQIPLDKSSASIPQNLLYPSGFLVDKENIGLIHYDYEFTLSDDDKRRKIMKISLFNISKRVFKELNIVQTDLTLFRYGHQIIPNYNQSDSIDNLMIFGGCDFGGDKEQLAVVKIDFANGLKFSQTIKTEKAKGALPPATKQFQEDNL